MRRREKRKEEDFMSWGGAARNLIMRCGAPQPGVTA
jgi:hypothetical protein